MSINLLGLAFALLTNPRVAKLTNILTLIEQNPSDFGSRVPIAIAHQRNHVQAKALRRPLFSFHAAMEPELSKLVALERNPQESKTNRRCCCGHLLCFAKEIAVKVPKWSSKRWREARAHPGQPAVMCLQQLRVGGMFPHVFKLRPQALVAVPATALIASLKGYTGRPA